MAAKPFPLLTAIKSAGGITALAKEIGVTPSAIVQWRIVPPLRVLQVEKATGVPRWVLRPDLYPPDADAAARVMS